MINEDSKNLFLLQFGRNLESYRKNKNFSYRGLAQRCDLDHSYISKIEKGEVNVTIETILELMKGLNLQASQLFNFEFDLDQLSMVK